jgi:hypothetical protein
MKNEEQPYQKQIVEIIANLVGEDFNPINRLLRLLR